MTLSKKQRKMVKTDLAQAADTVDEDQTTAVALIVTDIGGLWCLFTATLLTSSGERRECCGQ